jgi:hypothetical protein
MLFWDESLIGHWIAPYKCIENQIAHGVIQCSKENGRTGKLQQFV